MSKKISGAEYPLAKIFSSDFDYVIPSYQRPYALTTQVLNTAAWNPEQVTQRQADLLDVLSSKWDLAAAPL